MGATGHCDEVIRFVCIRLRHRRRDLLPRDQTYVDCALPCCANLYKGPVIYRLYYRFILRKTSALDLARCLPVPNFRVFFVVESRTISYSST